MTDSPSPPLLESLFPILELVSFVDAYTVVLVGPGAHEIKVRDELYVLGIGTAMIPRINVPLITPKARLLVSLAAGHYVLAHTPADPVDVHSALGSLRELADGLARHGRHRPLTTDDQFYLGDPGTTPVRIGDTAIRAADFSSYIRYRASR